MVLRECGANNQYGVAWPNQGSRNEMNQLAATVPNQDSIPVNGMKLRNRSPQQATYNEHLCVANFRYRQLLATTLIGKARADTLC